MKRMPIVTVMVSPELKAVVDQKVAETYDTESAYLRKLILRTLDKGVLLSRVPGPRQGGSETLQVCLPAESKEALEQLAKNCDMSVTALVRQIIKQG